MATVRSFDPLLRLFWEGANTPRWREPGRLIYDCELVYVSSGEAQMTIGAAELRLRAGDVIVIPPGVWHETRVETGATRHCAHFDWNHDHAAIGSPLQVSSRNEYRKELEHSPPAWVRPRLPLVRTLNSAEAGLAERLFAAIRGREPGAGLYLWPLLRYLLNEPEKPGASPGGSKSARAALAVKHLIETRYREPLDYADFCEETRLSRCHLCAIFSQLVGMPPAAYLNHVRLEAAAGLLLAGGLNIAEAGRACGIANANYFSRLFRQKFGHSPQEYIKEQSELLH